MTMRGLAIILLAGMNARSTQTRIDPNVLAVKNLAKRFDGSLCREAISALHQNHSAWEHICSPISDLCRFVSHVGTQDGITGLTRSGILAT